MRTLLGLRSLADRFAGWPAVVACLALIIALSSIPNQIVGATSGPTSGDKLAHLAEYAGLAFLLTWALRRSGVRPALVAAVAALAGAAAFGIIDELYQRLIPGRDSSAEDFAADAAGAALGAAAAVALEAWTDRARGEAARE
ncbi:MAG TPA: VanZ family protein [Dehalococcoidia bacterium]|nr:VanZ family protein [Dehalococcoidia bacterium]